MNSKILHPRPAILRTLILGAVLGLALVSGCTWVKKSSDAQKVRVVPADRVADCRKLGSVTTYTQDSITVVNRSEKKVAKELETLAMNDAARQGADTIVATSKIVEGRQDFALYRCL